MFGVTGAGLSIVKYYANDHKKARWNLDAWDRVSHRLITASARLTWLTIGQQSTLLQKLSARH